MNVVARKELDQLKRDQNQKSMNRILLLLTFSVCFASFWSCDRDQDFITDGSVAVRFSLDTLTFDTVFTEIGSATRFLKIYNDGDRPIKIGKVYLENGDASKFRINVDGISGREVEDVTVFANDSIYVFAEVTVDPDQPLSVSPFVISENLFFETNDRQQKVVLDAWGQNANYFPSRFNGGQAVRLTCDLGELDFSDPKPYVFYGVVFIDSCTVNIPAGTQIYVHGGIARNEVLGGVFNDGIIITQQSGRIRSRGTLENPVVFQGDRLEQNFQELDGQWTGVVVGVGSTGNIFEHTTIKNSIFGVYADSAANVRLNYVNVHNTTSSGIIGIHSTINAQNVLVYNNGGNSVQLIHGGDYNFDYTTLASYGVDASALGMSNFICYDDPLTCQNFNAYRLNARFRNSIIYGSKSDQLILADISGGQTEGFFNVNISNSVVGVDDLLTDFDGLYANFFEGICTNCVKAERQDPLFLNPSEDDYHLDSLSVAEGIALPIRFPLPINIDLEGKQRDPNNPDAGALERGN